MKLLRAISSAAVLVGFASASMAGSNGFVDREEIGRGEVAGETVVLYDDGFWRHADSGGERCTPLPFIGSFCALPSEWARFPQQIAEYSPTFVSGTNLPGEVYGMFNLDGGRASLDSLNRYIATRTLHNGLQGARSRVEIISVNGRDWRTFSASVGGTLKLFSILDQHSRIVVAETAAWNTTFLHKDHKQEHTVFLAAIELDDL